MARTAIVNTQCARNSSAVQTETVYPGGATGTGAGYYFGLTGMADERFLIYLRETGGATGSVWIKEGDYDADSQGDLEVIVGASVAKVVGPLEGARFRTSGGAVNIDTGGFTGVISGIALP